MALLIIAGTMFPGRVLQSQQSRARQSASKRPVSAMQGRNPVGEDSLAPLIVPFRPGEILNYRLTWSVFLNAASVQLGVVEWRDFFNTPTWHLRANVRSQPPLRSLAEVDDQFDSYADTASLESRQYEIYLDELGDKQNTILQLVSTSTPNKGQVPTVLVKPHTRDPLAALYLLRTIDWKRTLEFHAPVFDGVDLYEMSAHVDSPSELISISGHHVNAIKISVHLFRNGQQSRTKCSVWLSQDHARIPLLIEADVPYGRVRAELVSKVG